MCVCVCVFRICDLNLNLSFPTLFFIFKEFQPMAFAPDDSSLSSDQDTNQFLV